MALSNAMQDEWHYTERDAEQDAEILLTELVDLKTLTTPLNTTLLNLNSININNDDILSDNYLGIDDNNLQDTVLEHLKASRFINFAVGALRYENRQQEKGKNLINWVKIDYPQMEDDGVSIKDMDMNNNNKSWTMVNKIWPYIVPVKKVIAVDETYRTPITFTDEIMRQLKKDIERDRLLVNSVPVLGAALGLDAVIKTLEATISQVLSSSSFPPLSFKVLRALALTTLYKASRTHSGGIAFHVLQSLIPRDRGLLVPQSAATPPLRISVSLDTFSSSSGCEDGWGLVCKIICDAVYHITSLDDVEMDMSGVDNIAVNGPSRSRTEILMGKMVRVTFEDSVVHSISTSYTDEEQSDTDGHLLDTLGRVLIMPVTLTDNC